MNKLETIQHELSANNLYVEGIDKKDDYSILRLETHDREFNEWLNGEVYCNYDVVVNNEDFNSTEPSNEMYYDYRAEAGRSVDEEVTVGIESMTTESINEQLRENLDLLILKEKS